MKLGTGITTEAGFCSAARRISATPRTAHSILKTKPIKFRGMFCLCSSVPVETSYGWRVTARCAHGKQDGEAAPGVLYRAELDMETLVWTRRGAFRHASGTVSCRSLPAIGRGSPVRVHAPHREPGARAWVVSPRMSVPPPDFVHLLNLSQKVS
jgi:hypothetical protein